MLLAWRSLLLSDWEEVKSEVEIRASFASCRFLDWSSVATLASDSEIRAEVAVAEMDRVFLSRRFLVSVDLEGSDREMAEMRF